ncbi:unnamed protein product, partial [marine sediment metagenome]
YEVVEAGILPTGYGLGVLPAYVPLIGGVLVRVWTSAVKRIEARQNLFGFATVVAARRPEA